MKNDIKRMLKRFRLPVILVSALMLWAGFISTANAVKLYRVEWGNYITQTNYMFDVTTGGYNTEAMSQHVCEDTTARLSAAYSLVTFTCIGPSAPTSHSFHFYSTDADGNDSSTLLKNYTASQSPDDTDDCTTEAIFNPATGLCDPNYTPPPPPPPPPEKNLGGCSEGPSPYVSSGSE